MATPPDAALNRLGQIKGAAATWGPGAAGLDADRALFLKLGAAEVLTAFEEACLFKGKTRERNIKGGKSVAFPITGKMAALPSPRARPTTLAALVRRSPWVLTTPLLVPPVRPRVTPW
jgi:hypothetical protein